MFEEAEEEEVIVGKELGGEVRPIPFSHGKTLAQLLVEAGLHDDIMVRLGMGKYLELFAVMDSWHEDRRAPSLAKNCVIAVQGDRAELVMMGKRIPFHKLSPATLKGVKVVCGREDATLEEVLVAIGESMRDKGLWGMVVEFIKLYIKGE